MIVYFDRIAWITSLSGGSNVNESQRKELKRLLPPTREQALLEFLRAYAAPDAPARRPSPTAYTGPSIEMIVNSFPGRIVMQNRFGPWVWSRGFLPERPPEIKEASDIYNKAGGQFPGPVMWYQDLLSAKRGNAFRFSPFTTLYVPVDVYASIKEQLKDTERFCEAVKRRLIETSGQMPIRRGASHEKSLAVNILMVVLRKWKKERIRTLAQRFYDGGDEQQRRLVVRKINATHRLLRRHADGYSVPPGKV